ncbi:MAG: hypothetical protein JWL73_222, partial [Actinomycetia bacterium]|nr:hypothetical protein [Actinomycetes bacterium]
MTLLLDSPRLREAPPVRRRGPTWARRVLLAGVALGIVALIVRPLPGVEQTGVLVLTSAACAALVVVEHRRPRLSARAIVVAIGLVLVVAVVVPPRGSKDIWSYTMYGRTVAVHHAN